MMQCGGPNSGFGGKVKDECGKKFAKGGVSPDDTCCKELDKVVTCMGEKCLGVMMGMASAFMAGNPNAAKQLDNVKKGCSNIKFPDAQGMAMSGAKSLGDSMSAAIPDSVKAGAKDLMNHPNKAW